MRRDRRKRGMALVDFITGTLIFSATILTFGALTTSKLRLLNSGERMQHALASAEAQVDTIRLTGLSAAPAGLADVAGFRRVSIFTPRGFKGASGLVEARALRVKQGDGHQLYEVRVTLSWLDDSGPSRLSLSTIATLPAGGAGGGK
jgi:hypothetical protein